MARGSLWTRSVATPYEIRLAQTAESDFASLTPTARRLMQSVIQGIAELASVAPMSLPEWLTGPFVRPPQIQMQVAGHRLSYELDPSHRSLRVIEVVPFEAARPRDSYGARPRAGF